MGVFLLIPALRFVNILFYAHFNFLDFSHFMVDKDEEAKLCPFCVLIFYLFIFESYLSKIHSR